MILIFTCIALWIGRWKAEIKEREMFLSYLQEKRLRFAAEHQLSDATSRLDVIVKMKSDDNASKTTPISSLTSHGNSKNMASDMSSLAYSASEEEQDTDEYDTDKCDLGQHTRVQVAKRKEASVTKIAGVDKATNPMVVWTDGVICHRCSKPPKLHGSHRHQDGCSSSRSSRRKKSNDTGQSSGFSSPRSSRKNKNQDIKPLLDTFYTTPHATQVFLLEVLLKSINNGAAHISCCYWHMAVEALWEHLKVARERPCKQSWMPFSMSQCKGCRALMHDPDDAELGDVGLCDWCGDVLESPLGHVIHTSSSMACSSTSLQL
jgi:hypothetical protein